MFGKRNKGQRSTGLWTPPAGLTTQRQQLVRSVPFVYDGNEMPAIGANVIADHDTGGSISLKKGYDAAVEALRAVGMLGLRMEIKVMVDDSGSMTDEFRDGLVQQMLVRFLGFGLVLDDKIEVLTYGRPNDIHTIDATNYQDAPSLLRPRFGGTPMTEAHQATMRLVAHCDKLSMIGNLTDGDPNNRVTMSNSVIGSSGYPTILKNMAIKSVPYLKEIDDLPSYYEIRRDPNTGAPVLDASGNLIIGINQAGLRLVDNVDSKALDPYRATDEEFAAAMADEIATYLEVAGRVGLLTGVPGIDRTFF